MQLINIFIDISRDDKILNLNILIDFLNVNVLL